MEKSLSGIRLCAAIAALALGACASVETAPAVTAPAVSEAASKQIVVLVGLDGLRADAIDRFPDAAPNLRAMADRGVRATGMIPAMPSVTFVNFYSIATGLYADHTGIVSNSAYSRSLGRVMLRTEHGASEWWGGEPIWSTAEKQGVKTATMFWLGSEAEIAGARPSIWLPYVHMKPFPERTAEVLSWLAMPEADRPRLATVYFHAVDSAAHMSGVGSPEERDAIAQVDAEVGALVEGVKKLGLEDRVNFIVVADHGMTNVKRSDVINLDDFISFDDVFIPAFEGPEGASMSPLVHVFVENGDIDGVYQALSNGCGHSHCTAFRREHLPARWHLNNPDRTGDVVVVADEGWVLFGASLTPKYETPSIGVHGFDRHLKSMRATFIADGPRFADHVTVEPFDNVEVYGMIANILGVVPAKTDGDLSHVDYFMTPASE
ncbi:MAG TPA: alkaline phosphatase family protein [Amphiplicatus sp.]|nr:alkaline phosphatase family protein [Amphiplicatus sp.]